MQNLVAEDYIFLYYMQGWMLELRCPRQTLRKGSYSLHMLYKNIIRWKQVSFLILSGDLLLRVGPFHAVDCVKSVDFKMFFVYILNLLRVPFWHIYT